MHIKKENLPVTMDVPGFKMQSQMGWEGMTVAYCESTPMDEKTASAYFKDLPGKCCPAPHYGYMIKGSMIIKYADGKKEVMKAGEIFYLPAGHTGWSDEGATWIEFSPEKY